jgi:hypothetical protein
MRKGIVFSKRTKEQMVHIYGEFLGNALYDSISYRIEQDKEFNISRPFYKYEVSHGYLLIW